MTRPRILDHLQVYPFWIVDLASTPFTGGAFIPILGFQACTSPEITMDMADVKEGNWFYPHHFIRGATVSPMTLSRGVTFMDSDFYKWAMRALQGQGVVKRDLMLIHYFAISPVTLAMQIADNPASAIPGAFAAGLGGAMTAKIVSSMPPSALPGFLIPSGLGQTAAALAPVTGMAPPVEFAPRLPAKAWKLKKCIPTRWKGGGDFDAMSGDVSIAEMEIAPERIEELSLST